MQGRDKEISMSENQKKESREAFEINIKLLEKELNNSDAKNTSFDSENIKNVLKIKQENYQGLILIDIHLPEKQETAPLIKEDNSSLDDNSVNIKTNKDGIKIESEKILPLKSKDIFDLNDLDLNNSQNINSENSKKIIPPLLNGLPKVESELLLN